MPTRSRTTDRPNPPRLPDPLPEPSVWDAPLQDETHLYRLHLADQPAVGEAALISLEESVFERVAMNETKLTEPELIDVRFEGCDLAGAEWEQSSWDRVEWRKCLMVGFIAPEARLRHVVFSGCNLRLAQFRFGRLQSVRFEDCVLESADFTSSDLSGVVFAGCDLRNLTVSKAKLRDADFRGSKIEGLRAEPGDVRGARFDATQVVELVRLLGVKIG